MFQCFSWFLWFLDSTPGSAGMMGSGNVSDLAGGSADVTVCHVISSDESQATPPRSFLMGGSFEEKARTAHALSSPELTPTGVPYPSVVGQTISPVDADGYPLPIAGTTPPPDSQGQPSRPVSILTEAGVRLESASAWRLFRQMVSSPIRGVRLSAAEGDYNLELKAGSEDLDYEPVVSGDDSDVSEILLPKLTVAGILSLC